MRSKNIKCIILGQRDFGEFNKLVTIYSDEFGKISVIAKGARRINSKFTGHIETLNIANVALYFGPRNTILTEVQTIKSHKEIRKNLEKLKLGLQIAEITNKLIYDNQAIDNFFPILEESLYHLNHNPKESLIIYRYIIQILKKTGQLPDFKNTETNLSEKYKKFFHFLSIQPINEIGKIVLSQEEEMHIKDKLRMVIEKQIDKPLKSFYI